MLLYYYNKRCHQAIQTHKLSQFIWMHIDSKWKTSLLCLSLAKSCTAKMLYGKIIFSQTQKIAFLIHGNHGCPILKHWVCFLSLQPKSTSFQHLYSSFLINIFLNNGLQYMLPYFPLFCFTFSLLSDTVLIFIYGKNIFSHFHIFKIIKSNCKPISSGLQPTIALLPLHIM